MTTIHPTQARYWHLAVLVLIVITGLFLRVLGNKTVYDPDEWVVVESTYRMMASETLVPHNHDHPNHFSVYANALVSGLYSRVAYGKPYLDTFRQNREAYYRLTRFLMASLGTLTIVFAFFVGNEFSRGIGLVSAFLFSFLGSYVAHAHYARPDVPLVFFVVVTMWLLLRFQKTEQLHFLLFASVASALATSAKYPAVLLMVFIALGAAIIAWKRSSPRLFLTYGCFAFLTYIASLLITAPYLFLNYGKTADALMNETRSDHLGADGLHFLEKLAYYADAYYTQTGFMLLVFAVIGLVYGIRTYRALCIPVFVGIFFWLVMSSLGLHWERWALPMYITPIFLTSFGIYACFRALCSVPPNHRGLFATVFGGCLLVGAVPLVSSSVAQGMLFTLSDTRDVALAFMREHGIRRENTIYEGYTPFANITPRVSFESLQPAAEGKQYVVVSSYMYGRYLRESGRYGEQAQWYETVFGYPLVQEFVSQCGHATEDRYAGPYTRPLAKLFAFVRASPECYQGPTIRIYRIP